MDKSFLYRLEHIHHNDGYKQILDIGLFDDLATIRNVILELKDKEGFNKFYIDSFVVTKVYLNDFSYWENGFETLMDLIDMPL